MPNAVTTVYLVSAQLFSSHPSFYGKAIEAFVTPSHFAGMWEVTADVPSMGKVTRTMSDDHLKAFAGGMLNLGTV